MKYIIIIATPAKKDELLEALHEIGIQRLVVSDVRGYGASTKHTEIYRGQAYTVNNEPRLKIETALTDEFIEPVIKAVQDIAVGDAKGGGKVFVLPLEDCIRARTGERGDAAIS